MSPVDLPPLGEDLYEFYPAMSAQTHEDAVKAYARRTLATKDTALAEALLQQKAWADKWDHAQSDLGQAKTSRDNWKESHGRVVEGFAEVCESVGVQFDAPEAVAYAINAKISNAEHDKRAAEAALAEMRVELERLRKALEATLSWAEKRCPCQNEQPNPCPLCGADATKPMDICLSAENTLPRHILEGLRNAARALGPSLLEKDPS